MTKKKLNIDSITNELEGASLFFAKPTTTPAVPEPEKEKFETKPSSLSGSPFFEKPTPTLPPVLDTELGKVNLSKDQELEKDSNNIQSSQKTKSDKTEKQKRDTVIPRHPGTMTPRYHDTTTPRRQKEMISSIRKAVKEFGKEAATHRFTEAEKREIAGLVYTYRNQGIKTSENEITRISVNFIVEDFKENGENSILHKILQALN